MLESSYQVPSRKTVEVVLMDMHQSAMGDIKAELMNVDHVLLVVLLQLHRRLYRNSVQRPNAYTYIVTIC